MPAFPPKIKDDKICVDLGVSSVALIHSVFSTEDYKLKNTHTVHLNQPVNGSARRNHVLHDIGADLVISLPSERNSQRKKEV